MPQWKIDEEKRKAKERRDTYLPGVNILAQGGFIVFDQEFERGNSTASCAKSKIRRDQWDKAVRFMKNSKEKVCLLVLGSNDFKNFLIKEGKWLELGRGAEEKWSRLSVEKQIYFSGNSSGDILCKKTRQFIQKKVEEYVRKILVVIRNSGFEVILHSSLLERDWESCGVKNLDILFAHINSYLNRFLLKLNREGGVENKFGKIILFKFVNVAEQYFVAKREGRLASIFRESEFCRDGRTHRAQDALNVVAGIYNKEITEALKVV